MSIAGYEETEDNMDTDRQEIIDEDLHQFNEGYSRDEDDMKEDEQE